jgi:hypothetical protein
MDNVNKRIFKNIVSGFVRTVSKWTYYVFLSIFMVFYFYFPIGIESDESFRKNRRLGRLLAKKFPDKKNQFIGTHNPYSTATFWRLISFVFACFITLIASSVSFIPLIILGLASMSMYAIQVLILVAKEEYEILYENTKKKMISEGQMEFIESEEDKKSGTLSIQQ